MKPRCYREWNTYCSTELRGRRPRIRASRGKYSFLPPSSPLLLLKRGLSSLTGTRSSFLAKVRIIVSGSVPKKYLELVGIWSKDRHGIPRETAEGRVSTTSKRYEYVLVSKKRGGELRGTTNSRVISDLLI